MTNKTHYCIEVAESVKKYIERNAEQNINLEDEETGYTLCFPVTIISVDTQY
jgi:hypothetical protein